MKDFSCRKKRENFDGRHLGAKAAVFHNACVRFWKKRGMEMPPVPQTPDLVADLFTWAAHMEAGDRNNGFQDAVML